MKFKLMLLIFVMAILSACGKEKAEYEVLSFEEEIIEYEDRIQLVYSMEINNYSDEELYWTLAFPPYIQRYLTSNVGISPLVADGSSSITGVISVSKDGAELTTETISAIKNREIPIVEQIIIGKKVNLP